MSDYGTIDLSGAIVTASGVAACRPRALVVYGRSTQAGTPTPSAPVAIQSVAGQLYQQTVYAAGATYTTAGVAVTHNADGTCTVSGTATGNAWLWGGGSSAVAGYYVTLPAGTYTVCGSHSVAAQKMVGSTVSSIVSQTVGSATFTLTEETLVKAVPVIPSGTTVSGETAWVAVYAGSTAYPYVPYGHAGLWAKRTSDASTYTVTPIDLDGHELRSLTDGTRDEVTVGADGHAVLVQRVGHVVLDGSSDEVWSQRIPNSGDYLLKGFDGAEFNALVGPTRVDGYSARSTRFALNATGQMSALTDGSFMLGSSNLSGATNYLIVRINAYTTIAI